MLLGMEDAKRLEGYLRAGWCEDRVTQGGLPRRDRTESACLEEELASSRTGAAAGGVSQAGRSPVSSSNLGLEATEVRERHNFETTDGTKAKPARSRGAPRNREKEKWTYVQKIRTGAGGTGTELTVLFDSRALHTLILHAAAARAALAPVGQKKWVMSLDSGEVDESSCGYSVPLVDCQGNVHLLKARGVGYTIYTKERKVPPTAAAVFTEMEGSASRAHQAAGMVDLIVGQGYSLWHPQKVCHSWQTEDNLKLMRSEFPPCYMVRETTSTKRRV